MSPYHPEKWSALWPHQLRGLQAVLDALDAGVRRILLTSPTGGGKTALAAALIQEFLDRDLAVSLYTNRKLLVEQTSRVLAAAGHVHGVRAAGHPDDRHRLLQISSLQTEHVRVTKRGTWDIHPSKLVLVDEAHVNTGRSHLALMGKHLEQGAQIVGLTATPLDLGHLYDVLITAGKTSELRECGALVPCVHYAPDEPILYKTTTEGEDLTEKEAVKAIMRPGLWGRVWANFERINPEHKPTILFAPDVAGSLWFAEQFHKKGVSAAHIDGSSIWVDGRSYESSQELREEILGRSRTGLLVVLCNRFVLREGVDAPWLGHGILATVFGSLQSYLQSGGRLLRACPAMESVTIQDHGGNWWRHGSLNADREWSLGDTARIVTGLRSDRLRTKKEREPSVCPQCYRVLACGRCPCGFVATPGRKSRPVVTAAGELQEMTGDIFKPRRIYAAPDGPKLWEKMYHRSLTKKAKGRSFRAAAALFAYENSWGWPDPSWPLMPQNAMDWFLPVSAVPKERLIHGQESTTSVPAGR